MPMEEKFRVWSKSTRKHSQVAGLFWSVVFIFAFLLGTCGACAPLAYKLAETDDQKIYFNRLKWYFLIFWITSRTFKVTSILSTTAAPKDKNCAKRNF